VLELVVIAELLPNRYVSQSKDAHFDLPCSASYSWYRHNIEAIQKSVLYTCMPMHQCLARLLVCNHWSSFDMTAIGHAVAHKTSIWTAMESMKLDHHQDVAPTI